MITIIEYGKTDAGELEYLLQNLSEKCIVSDKEKDILNADKLILPNCNDISSSIKKLHLLNLFSLLRMIQKPVLGIGTGMHLMTRTYKNINAACLGCFPVECETNPYKTESISEAYHITIIKETKLLMNLNKEDRLVFNSNCFVPLNEFTTSTVEINGKISSSLEKDNLYGIQFIPEKSGDAGIKILQNYISL